jgi:hypothetical protein
MRYFNIIKIGTLSDNAQFSALISVSLTGNTLIGLYGINDSILVQTVYSPLMAGIVELDAQLDRLFSDMLVFGVPAEVVNGNVSVADAIEEMLQHPGTWEGSIYEWLLDWSDDNVVDSTIQQLVEAGVDFSRNHTLDVPKWT